MIRVPVSQSSSSSNIEYRIPVRQKRSCSPGCRKIRKTTFESIWLGAVHRLRSNFESQTWIRNARIYVDTHDSWIMILHNGLKAWLGFDYWRISVPRASQRLLEFVLKSSMSLSSQPPNGVLWRAVLVHISTLKFACLSHIWHMSVTCLSSYWLPVTFIFAFTVPI